MFTNCHITGAILQGPHRATEPQCVPWEVWKDNGGMGSGKSSRKRYRDATEIRARIPLESAMANWSGSMDLIAMDWL